MRKSKVTEQITPEPIILKPMSVKPRGLKASVAIKSPRPESIKETPVPRRVGRPKKVVPPKEPELTPNQLKMKHVRSFKRGKSEAVSPKTQLTQD